MKQNSEQRPLAEEIADAIQFGEYRAGHWLRQVDLEERFSATRFDVRSALDALVTRKVVQHVKNRGYKVPLLDSDTLDRLREVRIVLECWGATAIAQNATDADVARLRELASNFSAAAKSGTHMDQSRTNKEFHETMHALTGNPVLVETIWSLRDRGRPARFTVWRSLDTLTRSDEEHHRMVDLIEKRDVEGLSGLIEAHIRRPK